MNIVAMRKTGLLVITLALVVLTNGCSSMTNTDKGVLAGGGLGAGTGALIGSATGHTGLGAVVGGAVGAVSGGLVGNAVDGAERKAEARAAAVAAAPPAPLGLVDVAQLAQQRVSDDIIITQIRTTGSVYHLSAQDIGWLKDNGVSDPVVREMQATACRAPHRVVSVAPVYPAVYRPVYVVPEPPPVRVGFGVGYYGGRCCR